MYQTFHKSGLCIGRKIGLCLVITRALRKQDCFSASFVGSSDAIGCPFSVGLLDVSIPVRWLSDVYLFRHHI